jgi:4-nitrophenyl phosphatase
MATVTTDSVRSNGSRPPVVLLDLDGVVWLAHQPIPGSAEAIAALRAAGVRVLFVTNNSSARLAEQEEALARIGVPAAGDVVTSALAAALLVEPGETVHVCGGPGIVEALEQRGARVSNDAPVTAVVVGINRRFDYDTLRAAAAAVRGGARLIGTNDDATYPTPDGPIPGGGAILAAVQVASGATPVVAGKPHEPMASLVRHLVGDAAAAAAVMVGDRPETDGLFAQRLGCRYAQVWSGVTPADSMVQPVPDLTGANLASVVEQLLAMPAAMTAEQE